MRKPNWQHIDLNLSTTWWLLRVDSLLFQLMPLLSPLTLTKLNDAEDNITTNNGEKYRAKRREKNWFQILHFYCFLLSFSLLMLCHFRYTPFLCPIFFLFLLFFCVVAIESWNKNGSSRYLGQIYVFNIFCFYFAFSGSRCSWRPS